VEIRGGRHGASPASGQQKTGGRSGWHTRVPGGRRRPRTADWKVRVPPPRALRAIPARPMESRPIAGIVRSLSRRVNRFPVWPAPFPVR
jgi:hypothetical protein